MLGGLDLSPLVFLLLVNLLFTRVFQFNVEQFLATVSVLAAVAAGLSLYATPQRALLHARVTDMIDSGRERAVAGLTPAVVRYGPAVRRWAGDLALLGPAAPGPARTLSPITAGYLR